MRPEVNPKNLGVKMLRCDFGKVALGAIASSALLRSAKGTNVTPAAEFPKTPGLTEYVGRFVVNTTYEDIPADVIELGKKSILDGLGLALADRGHRQEPSAASISKTLASAGERPSSSDRRSRLRRDSR